MTALSFWSEWGDLNSRPLGPEPSALPSALHPEMLDYYNPHIAHCQEYKIESLKRVFYNKNITIREFEEP